jgi:hypothetical protein
VKLPVPVPSIVFVLKVIVGIELVDHTTPRSDTVAPPSEVTLPPVVALLVVIPLNEVVEIVGKTTGVSVTKLSNEPYPVPTLFVA